MMEKEKAFYRKKDLLAGNIIINHVVEDRNWNCN